MKTKSNNGNDGITSANFTWPLSLPSENREPFLEVQKHFREEILLWEEILYNATQ